jgi:small subunit ribosomal protein S14
MARLSLKVKQKSKPKFKVRAYNRCQLCGRARGYLRRFKLCRLCFRKNASEGLVPGVIKSSW